VARNLSNPGIGSANGRQLFPISEPAPLVQESIAGRLSYPRASSVLTGLARDPEVDISSQPILTPITTSDEVLGPDKRLVKVPEDNFRPTAASLKSTKILSKFWGDEDTEPETDTDNQPAIEADASQFLTTHYDTSKKGKRGRPKKLKSPNKLVVPYDPHNIDNEHVHTRSKTGSHQHNKNLSQQ